MILVDENTARRMLRSLEEIRQLSVYMQCVQFRLQNYAEAMHSFRPQLLELAEKQLPAEVQIFLCEDGDVFFLSPELDSEIMQGVARKVAKWLGIGFSPEMMASFEVDYHGAQLLNQVEQKIEKMRLVEQQEKQRRAAELAARKRLAILNSANHADAAELQKKRSLRDAPEVMVIEDDIFLRRLVEATLRKDYTVTSIGDPSFALQTYLQVAPDILFLDINLPDVSGHDLLKKIVSFDPNAFVVMLSGQSDRENIMQAMKEGAKGFVAKPFTREKLYQYLDKACASYRKTEMAG